MSKLELFPLQVAQGTNSVCKGLIETKEQRECQDPPGDIEQRVLTKVSSVPKLCVAGIDTQMKGG